MNDEWCGVVKEASLRGQDQKLGDETIKSNEKLSETGGIADH